jgi:hypothetical protein
MCVIASGEWIVLRDRQPSDVESYLRWQTSGEWRLVDAPWENEYVPTTRKRGKRSARVSWKFAQE